MKKTFKIPVTWEVYAYQNIEAESAEEALEIFFKEKDKLPLAPNPSYVEDSYHFSGCNDAYTLAQTTPEDIEIIKTITDSVHH